MQIGQASNTEPLEKAEGTANTENYYQFGLHESFPLPYPTPLAWLGLAWLGLAWLGLACLGLVWKFVSATAQ
jgi:hypothetical protein